MKGNNVIRNLLLKLHRWMSLVAGLPLLVLGLTGAVLSVESELDRWLNPSLWQIVPGDRKLDYQASLEQVRARHPRVTAMRLPPRDDVALEFSLPAGRLLYFDPYAGRILGERRRDQILLGRIHQFHTRLLAGTWGGYVMGTASLVLVLVSLSGLVLWWRAKIFFPSGVRSTKRFNFEAHHALGLYGTIFWLVIGTTGAMMTFESSVDPAIQWLTRSPETQPPQVNSAPAAGRTAISLDEALRRAHQALPQAEASLVTIPGRPTDALVVFMKHPEDRTPAGRSRAYLDQYSGRVLHVTDTRQVPLGTQIRNHIRPIHTGDLFGWPSRALAAIASLALVAQVFTGLVLWYRGRQARRAQRNRVHRDRPAVVK